MIAEWPAQVAPALHLVRHGQSTWNVEGLVQGQNDTAELTAVGQGQAARVAEKLTGVGVTRLLTSDLRRAVQTADILGAVLDLTPIPTTLLREQSLGRVEGMTSGEAAGEWQRAAEQAFDEYGEPVPPTALRVDGGESVRDVRSRAGALLAAPWVTDAGGDVVIVSHGDTIRIVLGLLLGDDPDEPVWREVGNAEINSVYRDLTGRVRHVRTAVTDLAGPVDPRRDR